MADDEVPLTSALLAGGFGYALATMTGLLTANGGAVALLMTLVGTAWSHSPADGRGLAQLLRWPIGSFAGGIVLAIATEMLSYVS